MYDVRLFRGIKEPSLTAEQLVKAEKITGFWKKGLLLLGAVVLIAMLNAYAGIGHEPLSKQLNQLSSTEYEGAKLLFAAGQILWSLLCALFILTIPSLVFWAVTDIGWKKFIIVQFFVLSILLMEEILLIPVMILFGLGEISNPFSFGIIGQLLTSKRFIHEFLAGISIFKLWGVYVQYKYIRGMTERSKGFTLLVVIGTGVVILLFSAFLSAMRLETLL